MVMVAELATSGPAVYAPVDEPGMDMGSALNQLASRKESIDRDVVAPILESNDLYTTFADKRETYKNWRNAWVAAVAAEAAADGADLSTVMESQDAQDEQLKSTFIKAQVKLGEPATKALLGAIDLKKIVRGGAMPHFEDWPEDSCNRIGHLFASSELCVIGVLHYLATGIGRTENVQTLADWSFAYIESAYGEAGRNGPFIYRLAGEE